ncbi:glycosyltransferase family 4 protein [Aequorivita sp. KMM 9714]|uniref:glycosyltransferase family 4 protein n=1 Tax=Aequorivita sp. KMM 9714 TaxID=2707173 RepID=UPI0013EAFF28|nr:glycosyltransferase family 4 protein [Aequorivita sp. KMM 9714]NGX84760.1 glycosyltransferase family 4 protein [Aequorivita sp. KMM 9714]
MIDHKLIRITTVPQSLRGLLKGQLKFMSENGFDVIGVSSPGDALEDVKKNEGIRVRALQMTRSISIFQDLKSLFNLFIFFKKEKPQIVHSHTPKAGTLSMLAAKLAGVPYRLHTIAGLPLLEAKGKKRLLLDIVEKITYACATHIYPNSVGLKDIILKANYTNPKKLKVLANGSSNGINTAYFDPNLYSSFDRTELRNKLQIASDDFIFIFVGRLVADKGINELIAAFTNFSKTNDNVKLLLVGPYEEVMDPLYPETISQINTNSAIISVGVQADVRPYFAIADSLVFPSYREGFPNVVMQAGAMGLPSIVTNINGCNEIITHLSNGLIIPVKNIEAIENSMSFMLFEKNKYNLMKGNSREFIVGRYNQHMVWKAILNEYEKILNPISNEEL